MIKSAIFSLLLLLSACSHNEAPPPLPDMLAGAKADLQATGEDIKYDYENLSAWQVNQAFGDITGGYNYGCGVESIAPLPCKRFGAVGQIMFDGMERQTYDEVRNMSFNGVFTGETIATYHVGGQGNPEAKLDYGIVKLTATAHDDWRLDIKLAINGEFNDINTKIIDDYWVKGGGIKAVGGVYTIPDTGNDTYIFGEFSAKKR
jgi:hypothetical protein